jgi:hypothetical protein
MEISIANDNINAKTIDEHNLIPILWHIIIITRNVIKYIKIARNNSIYKFDKLFNDIYVQNV